MSCDLGGVFVDVLSVLPDDRRAHSLEVGRKCVSVSHLVTPALRSDLIAAGTLHDIGYAYEESGLHALDGARYLAAHGFSSIVCNLVLHHSASSYEAKARGIDLVEYKPFGVAEDLGELHQLILWADMTTGPTGLTVTVEERLEEICARYGPEDVVTRFIEEARLVLVTGGQSPGSSMNGCV